MYDEVTVAVLSNSTKSALFTIDERLDLLQEAVALWSNIKVTTFHGLLVEFCASNNIGVIVKGLRAVSDFDYELQMAQMNYRLAKVETAFIATNPEYGYLSSSLIKEISRNGGDVSGLVPDNVLAALAQRHNGGTS
jgi:pantetheine-phosphate adenylyltransferase